MSSGTKRTRVAATMEQSKKIPSKKRKVELASKTEPSDPAKTEEAAVSPKVIPARSRGRPKKSVVTKTTNNVLKVRVGRKSPMKKDKTETNSTAADPKDVANVEVPPKPSTKLETRSVKKKVESKKAVDIAKTTTKSKSETQSAKKKVDSKKAVIAKKTTTKSKSVSKVALIKDTSNISTSESNTVVSEPEVLAESMQIKRRGRPPKKSLAVAKSPQESMKVTVSKQKGGKPVKN